MRTKLIDFRESPTVTCVRVCIEGLKLVLAERMGVKAP